MPEAAKWGKRPTTKTDATAKPSLDEFVKGKVKTSRLNLILPESLHTRVKIGCANEKISMTDVVVEFLESRFPAKK